MTRFALPSVVLTIVPALVACHGGGRCCPPPCDPVMVAPRETLVVAQGDRFEPAQVPALDSENADALWAGLIQGNMRFREGHSQNPRRDASRRAATAKSQSPKVVVLACADSRVAPEVLFDQGIGDLFVVRVAGNMSTPEVDASIEYAVEHLGSRLIVVLGHERCGAVTAAIAGGVAPGHLPALLARIKPAVDATSADEPKDARLDHAIATNARLNAESLAANEILKEAAHKHGVVVRAAVYDLDTGTITEVPMKPAGEPAAHH